MASVEAMCPAIRVFFEDGTHAHGAHGSFWYLMAVFLGSLGEGWGGRFCWFFIVFIHAPENPSWRAMGLCVPLWPIMAVCFVSLWGSLGASLAASWGLLEPSWRLLAHTWGRMGVAGNGFFVVCSLI